MNHVDHVEDRFSDLYDGTLTAPERRAALDHLAACTTCRAAYATFERATGALRALSLAPTPAAHVDEVLAAVATTRAPRARRSVQLLSHAAAVVLGLGLALGLRGCGEGADAADAGERVVEVVREVPVEVPVEVVREVRIEVPIEVVREVPVEVVREVPVERVEYVDRPVPNPLQVDAERGLRFLADVGGALSEVARAARAAAARDAADAARVAQAGAVAMAEADAPPPPAPRATVAARPRGGAPLRILRTDDRVRIQTRGALAAVVPALIDTLDDADPAVARAAEQHLEALRSELDGDGVAPPVASALTAGEAARPGGLRALLASSRGAPEAESDPGLRARWQSWWLDRSTTTADGPTL